MDKTPANATAYSCTMHSDVRQNEPGKCPSCGMPLMPENARFGLLRHILGNPRHLVIMAAVMVALMAAAMMLVR